MLKGALQRAAGSKRYERVGVLYAGYDYDGFSDKNGEKLDFKVLGNELVDNVFRDTYNFEVHKVTVECNKDDETMDTTEQRTNAAEATLLKAVSAFNRDYDKENDLMIFYYRGYGHCEVTQESALLLW